MSLDVTLTMKGAVIPTPKSSGILIRRDGQTIEISEEEWYVLNPGITPVIFENPEKESERVYSANITHNLNGMADAAGIYYYLWRPEEVSITKAKELIDPLKAGLQRLKSDPEKFKAFNPDNGWGCYETLVGFVEEYLDACCEYPEADVEADR